MMALWPLPLELPDLLPALLPLPALGDQAPPETVATGLELEFRDMGCDVYPSGPSCGCHAPAVGAEALPAGNDLERKSGPWSSS